MTTQSTAYQRTNRATGLMVFAVVTAVLWIPLFIFGALLGWFSTALVDGFKQGARDFKAAALATINNDH